MFPYYEEERYEKIPEKVKIFLMSLALTGMLAGEASAGWIQTQEGRWWYATDDTGTSWYASGPGGVGWHWIDGNQDGIFECYAFDPDGWMYADTVTPDATVSMPTGPGWWMGSYR